MGDLRNWKTVSEQNAAVGAINWAEGMPPALVNDSARAMMADLRGQFEDGGWFNWGHTISYQTGTVLTVPGDQRDIYSAGRRIRTVGVVSGTIFGTIVNSDFIANTTSLTITWDGVPPQNEALIVSVSLLAPSGVPIPDLFFRAQSRISLAAADSLDLSSGGHVIEITGNADISSLGSVPAGAMRLLRFRGQSRLKYHATNFILPGNTDINVQNGDCGLFVSLGSGAWYCAQYSKASGSPLSLPPTGVRNRITNGDMRIDQERCGTSVTLSGNGGYILDQVYVANTIGSISASRVAAGPAGFTHCLSVSTMATATQGVNDSTAIQLPIEGYEVADLNWGTNSAQPITLSFWVYSSLTGQFSGSIRNAALNRSYTFTYSISTPSTWEQKTITIVGDIIGTWAKDNSVGLWLALSLGAGANHTAISGQWVAGAATAVTGSVKLTASPGAFFNLTGVQLERGGAAGEFEHRSYGAELSRCQRYYCKTFPHTIAVTQNAGTAGSLEMVSGFTSVGNIVNWRFPVSMRATPTIVTYNPLAANANWGNGGSVEWAPVIAVNSTEGCAIRDATNVFTRGNIHVSANCRF